MEIQSTAAIVTGGASGLGRATAEMLAARGAKVTVFDLNHDLGTALAKRIGGRFAPVNVTDSEAVAEALAQAEAVHGVARILVNCAGTGIASKTVDRNGLPHALDAFERVIRVNLLGNFNALSKFAARLSAAELVGEERGVVINTASVAAFDGQIGQAAYSASKGGIVGMTLPIARDLAQLAIRVNTIAPGLFHTPLLGGISDEAKASLEAQVPFPSRLGKPEEYAHLVAAIIGNPMLNGEVIRLDGAIRMTPR
jgi:NAD(P)-dependent dehydrogenase (short-subunit alcohol dehydrogenase family)